MATQLRSYCDVKSSGLAKGAQLGVVAPRARRGRVAHELQKGLAREAEVPREARLDDARAQRVLVLEVRRRQVGRRHGVLAHVVDWAVSKPVGRVVAAHVGARRLLRNVPATGGRQVLRAERGCGRSRAVAGGRGEDGEGREGGEGARELRPELHESSRAQSPCPRGRTRAGPRTARAPRAAAAAARRPSRRPRRRASSAASSKVEGPRRRPPWGRSSRCEWKRHARMAWSSESEPLPRSEQMSCAAVLTFWLAPSKSCLHRRVDGIEGVAHDLVELRLQLGRGRALKEVLVALDHLVVLQADRLHLSTQGEGGG